MKLWFAISMTGTIANQSLATLKHLDLTIAKAHWRGVGTDFESPIRVTDAADWWQRNWQLNLRTVSQQQLEFTARLKECYILAVIG